MRHRHHQSPLSCREVIFSVVVTPSSVFAPALCLSLSMSCPHTRQLPLSSLSSSSRKATPATVALVLTLSPLPPDLSTLFLPRIPLSLFLLSPSLSQRRPHRLHAVVEAPHHCAATHALEVNEEYCKCLHGVVDKLFKSMATGLGLEEHELKEVAGGDDMIYLLKINYYPPCPCPDLVLGVPQHTDMSYITILVPNEVQGLQASRDGQWYDVKYVPNALIVHIGDQMEILSNGKYKAVLHRTTVNENKTRMSWPVFIEPQRDHEVGPHPKLVNQDNPPKYKTKKYKDYAYCKLNKIPQ